MTRADEGCAVLGGGELSRAHAAWSRSLGMLGGCDTDRSVAERRAHAARVRRLGGWYRGPPGGVLAPRHAQRWRAARAPAPSCRRARDPLGVVRPARLRRIHAPPGRDVASAAADVASVADALGIERFAVMGHSGGAAHALACAALLPDRVLAAICGSGLAPYHAEGLDWFAGMPPPARRSCAPPPRDARRWRTTWRRMYTGEGFLRSSPLPAARAANGVQNPSGEICVAPRRC
jgi:pimeloyl-ACP methyl ester carboxylesterase